METDERRARIRELRRRLVREGPGWTRDREQDYETVTVPERDCNLLRDPISPVLAAGAVPRCRALRLPDPSFEPSFEEFRPF